MKKPPLLRAALTAALDPRHHLSADPTRLLMVASNATIHATGAPGSGFEYRYTLELTFLDFVGDPTEISVPLLLWIERYQHQLLASPEAAARGLVMTFELLEADKFDAHIAIQLTETVRFAPRGDGGHDLVYPEEPVPMAFEDGPPLHIIYLDGNPIARCQAHPDIVP